MNYIYNKGKGWVIEPNCRTVRFIDGLTRIEPRLPEIGEKYAIFGKYRRNDNIVINGELQYDELLKNWGDNKTYLKYFNTLTADTVFNDGYIYITLVPV